MKERGGFWKDKIDKPLARLKEKERRLKIWYRSYYNGWHRNKKNMRNYYVQLYTSKLLNLEEIDKFLPTTYQEETRDWMLERASNT